MRSYDSTAQFYDSRYAEEQERKYEAALESVKPSGLVLDIGCGSGLFFKHAAREAETLVGVDSSRRLLLEAQKRARGWRNVCLIKADADFLPLKNDSFDVVFAFTVLQNIPKPLIALKELGRVVKTEGPVVVTGLKKVVSSRCLRKMLQNSGLSPFLFIDADSLTCNVVVSIKCSK